MTMDLALLILVSFGLADVALYYFRIKSKAASIVLAVLAVGGSLNSASPYLENLSGPSSQFDTTANLIDASLSFLVYGALFGIPALLLWPRKSKRRQSTLEEQKVPRQPTNELLSSASLSSTDERPKATIGENTNDSQVETRGGSRGPYRWTALGLAVLTVTTAVAAAAYLLGRGSVGAADSSSGDVRASATTTTISTTTSSTLTTTADTAGTERQIDEICDAWRADYERLTRESFSGGFSSEGTRETCAMSLNYVFLDGPPKAIFNDEFPNLSINLGAMSLDEIESCLSDPSSIAALAVEERHMGPYVLDGEPHFQVMAWMREPGSEFRAVCGAFHAGSRALELSDAAEVWCQGEEQNKVRVLMAADVLGLHDFDTAVLNRLLARTATGADVDQSNYEWDAWRSLGEFTADDLNEDGRLKTEFSASGFELSDEHREQLASEGSFLFGFNSYYEIEWDRACAAAFQAR